jgi:hypothetical protein
MLIVSTLVNKFTAWHLQVPATSPYLETRRPISLRYTVEPAYNDIGLYDTSFIVRYSVAKINSSLLTITLYSSVKTTKNIQSLS